MDIRPIIIDTENRAKACGLSIGELCAKAGIHRSTWQRWKSGDTEPLLSKWKDVEEVLDQYEHNQDAAA